MTIGGVTNLIDLDGIHPGWSRPRNVSAPHALAGRRLLDPARPRHPACTGMGGRPRHTGGPRTLASTPVGFETGHRGKRRNLGCTVRARRRTTIKPLFTSSGNVFGGTM